MQLTICLVTAVGACREWKYATTGNLDVGIAKQVGDLVLEDSGLPSLESGEIVPTAKDLPHARSRNEGA